MNSVLERLRATAPGERVRNTRILIAGVVVFVVVLAIWALYIAIHPPGFTLYPVDLGVYRAGGLIVRHVSPPYNPKLVHPLYDTPLSNVALSPVALKFTYTPFAALFFAAVSFVPWSILPHLSQAVNLAALVAAAWCTMGALGYRDRRVRTGGALLGASAGLLTEPVFRTMYLGQINLILMAVIIWDLTQPDDRRWKGLATGFAAGIKLVPLIFIPYLLLTRQFRAAAMACGGFSATVAAGFVILPGDSADWWLHGLFLQDGRTGFVGWGGNQSIRAIATRLAGSIDAATVPWAIGVVVAIAGGLVCAAMLDRAGHIMLGLLTTALVGLLISPISWDHHWVWVVPGMMVAAHYAVRAWQAGRWLAVAGCSALALGMLLVFAPWPGSLWSHYTRGPGDFTHGFIWTGPNSPVTSFVRYGDNPAFREYHWRGLQLLAGNAYVLAGLFLLVILGIIAWKLRLPPAGVNPAGATRPPVTAVAARRA